MNGIFVVPGGAVLGSGLNSMNQLRPSVFIRYPAPDPPDMTPNLLERGIGTEVGAGGRMIIGAGVEVGLAVAVAVAVGDGVGNGVDVGVTDGVTTGVAVFGISIAVGTGVDSISGISGVDVGVGNRRVGTGVGTGTAVGVADIGVEVGVGVGPLFTGVEIGPDVISTTDGPGPGIRTEVAVGEGDASGWITADAVGRGSSLPPPHPVIAMIVATRIAARIVTFWGARPVPSRVRKPLISFIGEKRNH
jgi:hypothetical protein